MNSRYVNCMARSMKEKNQMDLMSLYFSGKGRISRKVYWLASLPLAALWVLCELLKEEVAGGAAGVVLPIFLLASLVPNFMLSIKRSHDRDKSGWFVLVGVIPVLGPLWLLVELGFLRGTVGPNRFGADPLAAMPDADGIMAEAR